MKRQQGYLTVYVALSLMILLSLCLTLIEGVRQNTLRMETECVMDIALTSVLAEYHRELLNQYNLFFIDTSYGTAQPSYHRTEERLRHYLERNLAVEEVFLSSFLYRDFLAMEVTDVALDKISIATDGEGAVFRRRAIEAVKDDIGITWLEEIAGWLNTVEGHGLDDGNIQQEKRKVDEEIRGYDGMEKQISETEWSTVSVDNPTEHLERKRSEGVLKWVVEDMSSLSHNTVNLNEYISYRKGQGMVSQGNMEEEHSTEKGYSTEEEHSTEKGHSMEGERSTEKGYSMEEESGFVDRLLFQEYLLRYSGYYGVNLGKGQLQYQVEYLIAGKDNDLENIKSVVNRISILREAANALYLFSDQEKCAEAEAVATLLAGVMLLPEIAPLLKVSIILGWAYAESLYDIKILLAGGKVPLLKSAESWHYDIGCIFEDPAEEAAPGSGKGLSYSDYLRILMSLTNLETLTFRFMDVVEMDIRQTPGNSAFRIDGCIDCLEATADIRSNYGYRYTITRQKKY